MNFYIILVCLLVTQLLYAEEFRFPDTPTGLRLDSANSLTWTAPITDPALLEGCGTISGTDMPGCYYQYIAAIGYIILRQDIHEPGSWGFIEEIGRTTTTSFPVTLPASGQVCFFVVATGGDFNSSFDNIFCYPPPPTIPIAPTIKNL